MCTTKPTSHSKDMTRKQMKLLTKPNTCCESRTWITDINTSPPKETHEVMII